MGGSTSLRGSPAGPAAEQCIGQHLQYLFATRPNRELAYWLREGRLSNAEVDYVAEFGGYVVPIEVMAGRDAQVSAPVRVSEKRVPFAIRFHADLPELQAVDTEVHRGDDTGRVRYRLLSLPLYLVERLSRIVEGLSATARGLRAVC